MRRSVVVVEPNRVAAERMARVLAAATGFAPVVSGGDPEQLKAALPSQPGLLVCDAASTALIDAWTELWPDLELLVFTTDAVPAAVDRARNDPRIRSILGWPSFGSIPRPLELGLVAHHRLSGEPLPALSRILPPHAVIRTWRPHGTDDADAIVREAGALLAGAGVPARTADRAGQVLHELLVNAMYVAPIDGWGAPRYALDRSASIRLAPSEVPTLRLGFDGQLLAVDVVDPFGRLRDEQVLDGVLRGYANDTARAPQLDTGRGGAGLGLSMVHRSSVATLVEVSPDAYTRVLWWCDVDIAPRDYRTLPASLHLFRSTARPASGWA